MILLYIATTAAFLVFFGFSIIKSMHMFQLNSYKVPTHIRWLRKNSRSLIPGAVGAVVTALLLICGGLCFAVGRVVMELDFYRFLGKNYNTVETVATETSAATEAPTETRWLPELTEP